LNVTLVGPLILIIVPSSGAEHLLSIGERTFPLYEPPKVPITVCATATCGTAKKNAIKRHNKPTGANLALHIIIT
jgi:hypothetical protein